jgi:hypothetical protein
MENSNHTWSLLFTAYFLSCHYSATAKFRRLDSIQFLCSHDQILARWRFATRHCSMSSQSNIATDGQSVSKSWCRAPFGAYDQIFITVWQLRSCFLCGAPSLTRGRVCLLSESLPALASSMSLSLMLRPTVSRPVCLGIKHPSGAYDQIFFFRSEYGIRLTVTFLIPWGALSDERTGLSFVCAAGPCQCSLSRY